MKKIIVLIIYILIAQIGYSQNQYIQINYFKNINQPVDTVLNIVAKKTIKQVNDSIYKDLISKGHFNASTLPQEKINDSTTSITVIKNKKFKTIRLRNLETIQESGLTIPLSRKREHLPTEELETYLQSLNNYFIEDGFPFANTKLENIEINKTDTISADLKINLNAKRYIDNFTVRGYEDFPKKTVKQFLNNNNLYNSKTIEKIENHLKSIPFITISKKPEVLFKKDSTTVFLFLKKKNVNFVEGLLSFNNSENGNLELNGFLNLKLENNFNNAEKFHLEYRNDNGDQTQLITSIDLPYIWNSSIGIEAQLNIQRRDSTYQRNSIKLGGYYKPSWQTNIGINYVTTTSNAIDNEIDINDIKTNGLELNAAYSIRSNNVLMPENLEILLKIGGYDRRLNQLKENQFTLDATFLKLLHLSYRSKFLGRVTGRYLNSENIQFNELYQFGGLGTIRGFNQNSIDSSFYTTIATEYRYSLNDQIYLHSILDIGIFENFNSKKLDKLYGYGGGIAILTKAGILNLSIANGRFQNAKVDLSSTVAHINLKINF